jgi:hypothetical protein
MLYARAFLLRNCGRFTHVSSDFGSEYHTHTFVTSEALYASLTRGVTWRHEGRFVDLEVDARKLASSDYFFCDYDISAKPLWFTPGLFVDKQLRLLSKQRGVVDKNDFNVVDEGHPSTGGGGRPYFVPTYGRIESVLPAHHLLTYALSPRREELEWFAIEQTFLLGKKRTMMQMVELSDIIPGQLTNGIYMTPYLQVPLGGMSQFSRFEVLAATARYILVRGELKDPGPYWEFRGVHLRGLEQALSIPESYLQGKWL